MFAAQNLTDGLLRVIHVFSAYHDPFGEEIRVFTHLYPRDTGRMISWCRVEVGSTPFVQDLVEL
jgi:hypothetical protein